jgi:pimeloyl-ACP methyl ester carboxylesterase
VIMLHMLTRSREDWDEVAPRLADAGIHALAIDLRGHGASTSGPTGAGGEPDLSRMVLDVQAARAYLGRLPELVRPGSVGIVGASLGANLAILEASADPAIKSLALISAGLDYRDLRADQALRKYAARPALFVAGSNDGYAVRSMRTLAAIGPGLRETKIIEAGGHGTAMLANAPGLVQTLVDWFLRTLI